MKIINKFKTYMTEPAKCYVYKCKSICCSNAPLPEDFLPKHQDKIARTVYSGFNIGQNWIEDNYNSIIYHTTPSPLQLVGFDKNGKKVVAISKAMIEKLQIQSAEQLSEIIELYKNIPNYCPFLNTKARCNVYEQRPPICREFGTKTNKINICPEKASRLEILKMELGFMFEGHKEIMKNIKRFFKKHFSKSN